VGFVWDALDSWQVLWICGALTDWRRRGYRLVARTVLILTRRRWPDDVGTVALRPTAGPPEKSGVPTPV